MATNNINLEREYRSTRAALGNAGLDMNGSIDALYRDWHRWRDRSQSLSQPNRDQWWARHLAVLDRSCTRHGTGRARTQRQYDTVSVTTELRIGRLFELAKPSDV